jgi:hypothetical protein
LETIRPDRQRNVDITKQDQMFRVPVSATEDYKNLQQNEGKWNIKAADAVRNNYAKLPWTPEENMECKTKKKII